MLKKYSLAIKLSSFIVIIFMLLVSASVCCIRFFQNFSEYVSFYFSIGSFTFYICLIIPIRLNFVYLRVKSIYEDLLPKGLAIAEDSLQKDTN